MSVENTTPMLPEAGSFFITAMLELSILFIGISFLVGVLNELLPREKVQRWLSGESGRGYFLGAVLGSLTPFCSCSTIPFMVGLLRAKAGFGPTMTFLFTSPLVNPIIVPLFIALIGPKVTFAYVAIAIGLAVCLGFLLEHLGFSRFIKTEVLGGSSIDSCSKETSQSCCDEVTTVPRPSLQAVQPVVSCCSTSSTATSSLNVLPMAAQVSSSSVQRSWQRNWKYKGQRILTEAIQQFRKMMPYMVIGVIIGSFIHGFLPADFIAGFGGRDNAFAVPVSAVLGIPLYLRVSAMIPIAASLIAKGMSVGAVLALIIGGAGASLPEVAMLKGLFRLPLLVAFICSVLITAIVAGTAVNMVVGV